MVSPLDALLLGFSLASIPGTGQQSVKYEPATTQKSPGTLHFEQVRMNPDNDMRQHYLEGILNSIKLPEPLFAGIVYDPTGERVVEYCREKMMPLAELAARHGIDVTASIQGVERMANHGQYMIVTPDIVFGNRDQRKPKVFVGRQAFDGTYVHTDEDLRAHLATYEYQRAKDAVDGVKLEHDRLDGSLPRRFVNTVLASRALFQETKAIVIDRTYLVSPEFKTRIIEEFTERVIELVVWRDEDTRIKGIADETLASIKISFKDLVTEAQRLYDAEKEEKEKR